MKFRTIAPVAFAAIIALCGCGKETFRDEKAVEKCLEIHYDADFELVSSGKYDSQNGFYLDPEIETNDTTAASDGDEENDIYYVFRDENDVEFYATQIYIHGIGGHYEVREDYSTQWLMSQTQLLEILENSGYEFAYSNDIGYYTNPQAWLDINIEGFDDIRSATELVYEFLSAFGEMDYPNLKAYGEDWIYPVRPIISVSKANGGVLFRFDATDESMKELPSADEIAVSAEREYVYGVRAGSSDEVLPDEILIRYGPEEIENISCGDMKLPVNLYYSEEWECYYLWDNGKEINGSDIYYEQLTALVEAAGYKTTPEKDSMTWSNGENAVTIRRPKDDGSVVDFICYKNGEIYDYEGDISSFVTVIRLTERDLYELFGISFEFDHIAETAKVIVE